MSAQSENTGIDPAVVVEAIQRAISLIGIASHCALVDQRKGLLAKVLPETLDLIDDPALFVPGTPDLFGKKFKKAVFKDLKLSKEMDSLISTSRHGNGRKQFKPFQPFRQQPGKGPGYVQSPGMESTRMDPKAWGGGFSTKRENQFLPQPRETRLKGILNDPSLNQTDPKPAQPVQQIPASSRLKIDFQSIVEPAALAARLKLFLPNWQKITIDPAILDVMRGYKLEFLSPPIQEYIRNPLQSSHAESEKN